MKKTHIIGLVLIALAVGVIFSSLANTGKYANFTEAFNNEGKKFTIVGWLDHEQEIIAEPTRCTFYIKDKEDNVKKVVYDHAKPTDFERSESIVLTGFADGDVFRATELSLKCPSKYNDVKGATAKEQK